MSGTKTHNLFRVTWRGIALQIRHCPNWCELVGMDHIEVESEARVPLPITETGYRSHFIPPERIAEIGTVMEYVLAWLEHESQSRGWKKKETQARQLTLF